MPTILITASQRYSIIIKQQETSPDPYAFPHANVSPSPGALDNTYTYITPFPRVIRITASPHHNTTEIDINPDGV